MHVGWFPFPLPPQVLDKRRYAWIWLWIYNFGVILARLLFLMPYVQASVGRGDLQVIIGVRKANHDPLTGNAATGSAIPWELRWDIIFFVLIFVQRQLFLLPELGVALARSDRDKSVGRKYVGWCVACCWGGRWGGGLTFRSNVVPPLHFTHNHVSPPAPCGPSQHRTPHTHAHTRTHSRTHAGLAATCAT